MEPMDRYNRKAVSLVFVYSSLRFLYKAKNRLPKRLQKAEATTVLNERAVIILRSKIRQILQLHLFDINKSAV